MIFCEKKDGVFFLHPDLAAQLEEGGTNLEVIRQFGEFFEKKVIPQLRDVSPDDVRKLGRVELVKILQRRFDLSRILAVAPRLLPFGMSKVAQIPFLRAHQAARHLPAMFNEKLAGNLSQFKLGKGDVDGLHLLTINPAPLGVTVPAPVLFMEDDGAGLIHKAMALGTPGSKSANRQKFPSCK